MNGHPLPIIDWPTGKKVAVRVRVRVRVKGHKKIFAPGPITMMLCYWLECLQLLGCTISCFGMSLSSDPLRGHWSEGTISGKIYLVNDKNSFVKTNFKKVAKTYGYHPFLGLH